MFWQRKKSKDAQIDSMLERYKDLSGHIRVKYVNPKSKPYFYKDYTDNAPTSNSLIVVSDKRSKVIDYYDIYDYQSNMDYSHSSISYNNELKGIRIRKEQVQVPSRRFTLIVEP